MHAQQQPAQRQVGAAQAAEHARRVLQQVLLLQAHVHRDADGVEGLSYRVQALSELRKVRGCAASSRRSARVASGITRNIGP